MKTAFNQIELCTHYVCHRLGVDFDPRNRERGLTTTEVAILTFVLVTIALAVGVILLDKSEEAVNQVDVTTLNIDG